MALWTYEDWLENVRDAWVARLAVSTPDVWHLTLTLSDGRGAERGIFKRSPKCAEIVGHFVHIDDGKFDDNGKYWANLATVKQTAELLAGRPEYDHLLLYARGGLNSIKDSARRIVAMKKVFKGNGIYPFHFMYDTGLLEELKDIVVSKKRRVEERAGGFTDYTDKLVEDAVRPAGRALWREIKGGARKPFEPGGGRPGDRGGLPGGVRPAGRPPQEGPRRGPQHRCHPVGVTASSSGAVPGRPESAHVQLVGTRVSPRRFQRRISSVAPRARREEIRHRPDDHIQPGHGARAGRHRDPTLPEVAPLPRFQRLRGSARRAHPGHAGLPAVPRERPRTTCFPNRRERWVGRWIGPHGQSQAWGFDNDVRTMNSLLRGVLGAAPTRPFTKRDLEY